MFCEMGIIIQSLACDRRPRFPESLQTLMFPCLAQARVFYVASRVEAEIQGQCLLSESGTLRVRLACRTQAPAESETDLADCSGDISG